MCRCNDVIGCDAHMWSAVACLAGLTRLAIEDVRASLSSADVAPLAQLKDLRELALNADMAQDSWQAGLAEVPEQWSRWGAGARVWGLPSTVTNGNKCG